MINIRLKYLIKKYIYNRYTFKCIFNKKIQSITVSTMDNFYSS